MFLRLVKRNSLLLSFFAVCLLVAGLVLVELDKQYFQAEKRQLIQEFTTYYIDPSLRNGPPSEDLEPLAVEDLLQRTPATQERLRAKVWAILNGKGIIYRIRILRMDGPTTRTVPSLEYLRERPELNHLDIEAPGKLRNMNDFSNSLLMRNFSSIVSRALVAYGDREIGRLIVYYTSPREDAAIGELTQQYRIYAVLILLILGVLAGAFANAILLPMRNVINQLDASTPERAWFVARPRAKLEQLYNRMALEAVTARLQGRLREEIASQPQMTSWEVVVFAVRDFQARAGATMVACCELVAEAPGAIRPTGNRVFTGTVLDATEQADLLAWLEAHPPADGRGELEVVEPPGQPLNEVGVRLLADPDRAGIRYLFAMELDQQFGDPGVDGQNNLPARLVGLVTAGLQTLSTRNQLLVQERGRANISLSRNLGHDLTNIIATSKLELMALERALGNGAAPPDERRRMILLEALHGLLRSVKFMQETVNLYRAYAYLQHPVLEVHDGNQLLRDTLELFAISTSSKIDLREELAPDAPRCLVDPRLIKLALFNLFTNALEAIRKTDPDSTARGWIKIISRRSRDGGLCIAVEDSGIGIMTPIGQRAKQHEIEQIFELGYTTQRQSGTTGEGLGLNWVRTIVQDLHGGQIYAENTEDAGARFILLFPPLDATG